MPGMDGIETTALIRKLESSGDYYLKLPIVALTANVVSGQREMFLQNGIDDFLAKPIDLQKLNEILLKWLPPEKRRDSSPVQQADSEQEKIEVPDIFGVDVLLGLRNCGGKLPVYLNILEDFCKDAEARLVQISEALNNNEVKLYVTLVHALKGAALSIGAVEVGEKALWLEKEAKSVELITLKDKTLELAEKVQTLIANIRGTIEDKRGMEDDQEQLGIPALRMEILKTALEEMDIEAVNRMLLNFSSLSLDDRTKAVVAEIEQHILMFEYDEAIEKINRQL
jgi:CheY-like chemotaxis protein